MVTQTKHVRTSKLGRKFVAGKRNKTAPIHILVRLIRKQPWVYGFPEEANKWSDSKIINNLSESGQVRTNQ